MNDVNGVDGNDRARRIGDPDCVAMVPP